MNERERFRRVFGGEPVDRPPLLEEGVRDEVIERWRTQGLPPGKTHIEVFGLTPHEIIGPELSFHPNYSGRIVSLSPREYRRAFAVSPRRFPKDWRRTVKRLETRDHIVCIRAYRGFFQALGVEDWPTLKQVLRAVIREPTMVRQRMEMYADFCGRMLEAALRDVDPEFIFLSEPISDNKSTLISPAMFEDFAIPVYERVAAIARARGCGHILVTTYGNTASLFPSMIKAGVTMLWIAEAAEVPELDYRNLRRTYGSRLGLIGGIPLSLLRSESLDELKNRLSQIVIPLMQSGCYIPLAGGRIRDDILWDVYKCYRERLAEFVAG